MYCSNTALSPYSSYSFNKIVGRNYRFGLSRLFFRTKTFELLNEKDTIMIIPLYGNRGRYYLIGDLLPTGYLDFIYKKDISNEEFAKALALLKTELKGSQLLLNKINERSKLNDYLNAHYPITDKRICVNINFGTDYDTYFKSLSKNIRQNIRTRYNRLKREGINWEVDIKINTPISSEMKGEILKVYHKRFSEINGKKVGWLVRIVRHYINPITLTTTQMEGNFNAIMRIGDATAAILSGYVNNDNSMVILPRIAMNSAYSHFSPGLLLINETIKWLIQNTDITNLDLSRGDEGYKYAMGGTEHYNYSYEIKL